ncbi:extracellular calcium-sensing receptor-like [Anguilla rostrata]|uniref:extracellular calcium-sensing receptor-like n=1 Tax=Anguilla rostrata TaxID=7938 RepID=UPI0030D4FBCE
MRLLRLVLFALLTRAQYPSFNLLETQGHTDTSKNGRTTEGRIFTDSSYPTALCQCVMKPPKMEYKGELKFVIEDIHRNPELLPGITLGYRIYNSCGTINLLRATLAALTGLQENQLEKSCTFPRVQALIGHSSSGPSGEIRKIINPFNTPLICHLATILRTVPSDYFQIVALVHLMKHFGWTWVGMVCSVGTYSEDGSAAFIRQAKKEGICMEYLQRFSRTCSKNKTCAIAQTIKSSTSKGALAFMSKSYFHHFLESTEGMNLTNIQWISSEVWITSGDLLTEERAELLQGAMGFAITESHIPGLTEFLLSLRPSDAPDSIFLRTFWDTVFDCSLSVCLRIGPTLQCTCVPLPPCQALKNVFRAVLAMAHVVHTLVFIHSGQSVHTLHICQNKNGFQPQVPMSVCKEQTISNRKPGSCFDCITCPLGEISKKRDTSGYSSCVLENRFTEDGNHSIFSQRILGYLPAVFFILGVCFTTTVAIIIFWYRHNAITRANNSELSFLLLFSLKLCFLCSLTFIGRPSEWSCMLRHTAFGITFVLCIST